jgi:hypothetical protein
VRCPQCPCVGIFIKDCLGTKRCQGVSIPVVRSLEYFISQFGWVNLGALKEVNGVLHLRCKFVPKLDGKVHVGGAEGANELIFKCLDSSFSDIDMVIAGFNDLEATLLWGTVRFDCFCCLIVHDVDFWGVPFAYKKFEVLFVCV